MPNATISVYLNGDDYSKYWQHRDKVNKRAREVVKEEIRLLKHS